MTAFLLLTRSSVPFCLVLHTWVIMLVDGQRLEHPTDLDGVGREEGLGPCHPGGRARLTCPPRGMEGGHLGDLQHAGSLLASLSSALGPLRGL